jgi:hypothetical protein
VLRDRTVGAAASGADTSPYFPTCRLEKRCRLPGALAKEDRDAYSVYDHLGVLVLVSSGKERWTVSLAGLLRGFAWL